MTCFLETGPFSNRKNAESLPNLPPKREGGSSVISYLTHFPKKEARGVQHYFQFYFIFNFYKKEAREVFKEKSERT